MSLAINPFDRKLIPRITLCLFLIFVGTFSVWYGLGGLHSENHKIWIPEHPRYLNKVNGVFLKATSFTTSTMFPLEIF